jgi:hypothetical protein
LVGHRIFSPLFPPARRRLDHAVEHFPAK